MDGGEPAGTRIRPGDEGCLTTRTSIKSTTMLGNRSTKPSGIEIEEFPFNRIRRRKRDRLGSRLDFSPFNSSREGTFGDDGMLFRRLLMKPIAGGAVHATTRVATRRSLSGRSTALSCRHRKDYLEEGTDSREVLGNGVKLLRNNERQERTGRNKGSFPCSYRAPRGMRQQALAGRGFRG